MNKTVFMKMMQNAFLTAFLTAFLLPLGALAQTVVSELTVMGITKQSNGQESLTAVSTIKPGDSLQYVVVYKNTGKQSAKQMVATLPIPAETEFVASSASPATAMASLDGRLYQPIPLMRQVKQADGKLVTVSVPVSEYRFLRWPERELAAGASFSASARVRVISSSAAVQPAAAASGSK